MLCKELNNIKTSYKNLVIQRKISGVSTAQHGLHLVLQDAGRAQTRAQGSLHHQCPDTHRNHLDC